MSDKQLLFSEFFLFQIDLFFRGGGGILVLSDRSVTKNFTFYFQKIPPFFATWQIVLLLTREIFIQGEGAFPLVQLSISFLISCFEKHSFCFHFFQQLSL